MPTVLGSTGPMTRGPRADEPRGRRPVGYVYTLTGTVYVASGAVVSGAVVDLFDDATRAYIGTTTTNASGVYTFNPPNNSSTYRVNVKHPTLSLYGEVGGLVAV